MYWALECCKRVKKVSLKLTLKLALYSVESWRMSRTLVLFNNGRRGIPTQHSRWMAANVEWAKQVLCSVESVLPQRYLYYSEQIFIDLSKRVFFNNVVILNSTMNFVTMNSINSERKTYNIWWLKMLRIAYSIADLAVTFIKVLYEYKTIRSHSLIILLIII